MLVSQSERSSCYKVNLSAFNRDEIYDLRDELVPFYDIIDSLPHRMRGGYKYIFNTPEAVNIVSQALVDHACEYIRGDLQSNGWPDFSFSDSYVDNVVCSDDYLRSFELNAYYSDLLRQAGVDDRIKAEQELESLSQRLEKVTQLLSPREAEVLIRRGLHGETRFVQRKERTARILRWIDVRINTEDAIETVKFLSAHYDKRDLRDISVKADHIKFRFHHIFEIELPNG